MKYHVMPGDAAADDFKSTGVEGQVIVCRECLIAGDVDAETLHEFWEQRARFIMGAYGEDAILYHEKVAEELAQLLDMTAADEVNLWFEYELFCSANLWFCLWLLSETNAIVYRVEPVVRSGDNIWKGFGSLSARELKECFEARMRLTDTDIKTGADLWKAYRSKNYAKLREIAVAAPAAFPYLKDIVDAEIEKSTRPKVTLHEIKSSGTTEFEEIFAEFSRREGVYGYGDAQVQQLLQE